MTVTYDTVLFASLQVTIYTFQSIHNRLSFTRLRIRMQLTRIQIRPSRKKKKRVRPSKEAGSGPDPLKSQTWIR